MKPLGVNRVAIAVRDYKKAMDFYTKLLGASWVDICSLTESYGLKVAVSWDAGIELASPLPGRRSAVHDFLEQHGEGLMGVVFAVDNEKEALDRAKNLGIRVVYTYEFDQPTIKEHLEDRFKFYKAHILHADDAHGVSTLLLQADLK